MKYIKKQSLKIIILSIAFISLLIILAQVILKKNVSTTDLTSISSGSSQIIAILDTGFNEALINENKNKIINIVNVDSENKNINDELGHGTALTTLLLGSESMDLKGLLPNVKVILIKITDKNGKCTFESLMKGLTIAEKNNVNIINISLGGNIENEEINKKINDLYEKNITIVAASGDYGEKDLLYPANHSKVVSVASIDEEYKLSDFSNYNKSVTCSFQGENLNMISLNNGKLEKTNELYRTSYSTIYASAYIASIRDYAYKHDIKISNKKIFDILEKNDPLKNKKIVTDIRQIFK